MKNETKARIVEFSTQKGSWLAVEVPKLAYEFWIGGGCHDCNRVGMWHCAHADTCGNTYPDLKMSEAGKLVGTQELPPGEYKILGLAKSLTEEQWKDIVEYTQNRFMVFYDYVNKDYSFWGKGAATESGQSLMKSIGCNIVNPLGKEPEEIDFEYEYDEYYTPDDDFQYDVYDYRISLRKWQAEQDKLVNWLILRKK